MDMKSALLFVFTKTSRILHETGVHSIFYWQRFSTGKHFYEILIYLVHVVGLKVIY